MDNTQTQAPSEEATSTTSTEIEEPNARKHRTTHPVQKPNRKADQKREKSSHHEHNGAVQKRAKTTSESTTTLPPFQLDKFTAEEVSKLQKNLNPHKASDTFKIKPAIVRDLNNFLTPILTELYNRAIEENNYPDALKLTKVVELYKSKDRTLPANYRPISLLPILAKVFDTGINNKLMAHLLQHKILSPTQYAFRPNSGFTMALQAVINNIYSNTKPSCQKHTTPSSTPN
jgi:hypothetical protein